MKPLARDYHIADRRRRVAGLMARGLTQREITRALPLGEHPIVNPDTGQPYDLATVNRDTKHVTKIWKEQSVASVEDHKARHLAEVSEVKRSAWQEKDLNAVLRRLKAEADVLGLHAPHKQEHMGPGGGPIHHQQVEIEETSDEIRRIEQHTLTLTSVSLRPGR